MAIIMLYQFLHENDLFSSDKSGFLCLYSTFSKLTCTDGLYYELGLGKLVELVSINLKNYFAVFMLLFSFRIELYLVH